MPKNWLLVISSWFIEKTFFNTQKGAIAPLIVVLLLLGGLGVGLYLTQKPTNLKPKAGVGASVTFLNVDTSTDPPSATNQTVKLKLQAPWAVKLIKPSNPPVTSTGSIIVSGKVHEAGAGFFKNNGEEYRISYCDPDSDGVENYTYLDKLGKFSFRLEKGQKYCIKSPEIPGFKVFGKGSTIYNQVAGLDCKGADIQNPVCLDKLVQKEDRPKDSYDIVIQKDPKYAPPVYTESVSISEDPNFPKDERTKNLPYTNNTNLTDPNAPMETEYTFSKSSSGVVEPGLKTIYVKFISSDRQEFRGNPYPAKVSLTGSKPDLVITNILRGDNIYNVLYCNHGLGKSDAKFSVSITNLTTGKTYTNEQDLKTVPAPQTCDGRASFTCAEVGSTCLDQIQVKATVDSKNTVDESGEGNNQFTQSFTGQTTDYIRVTSPNGGENYKVGDKVKITWEASSNMQSFQISLNFTGVGYKQSIFTVNDPATRSFEWTVDDIGYLPKQSKPAKIVVTGFSQDGKYKTDESDNSFNIGPQASPYVRIINPIGDVSYKNGSILRVMWEAEGADAGYVLYYEYWNGKYFMPDYLGDPKLRSYNWKIDIGNFGTYVDGVPVRLIIEAYKQGVAAPVATFTTNYFKVTR